MDPNNMIFADVNVQEGSELPEPYGAFKFGSVPRTGELLHLMNGATTTVLKVKSVGHWGQDVNDESAYSTSVVLTCEVVK